MKNVLFWCGVQGNDSVKEKYRYGDFSWMEYSKKTWEYWCRNNNVKFVHYNKTKLDDHIKYKINWQRWLDIIDVVGEFDQVLAVDASIMVKWSAPNFFNLSENKWCGLIGNENLNWVFESIEGYKPIFDNYTFDYSKHYLAGFVLFNKNHIQFFKELREFYFKNHSIILEYEDRLVKRGRDQPIINYLLQIKNIETKQFPISYGANHMWRKNFFENNSILNDPTPYYIKYLNTWIFSGFPDRGESRTRMMKHTWELVKHNYE